MKILVAEDDRVTRTRILSGLNEWGHEGIGAADVVYAARRLVALHQRHDAADDVSLGADAT